MYSNLFSVGILWQAYIIIIIMQANSFVYDGSFFFIVIFMLLAHKGARLIRKLI